MANDELIAALERAAALCDLHGKATITGGQHEADAARIRTHIADLKAATICADDPEQSDDATTNSPRVNVGYEDGPPLRTLYGCTHDEFPGGPTNG